MRIVVLTTVLLIGLQSVALSQSTIGLYADSLGVDCGIDVPFPGPDVNAYIVGSVPAECGQPAGFRLDGIPEGWGATIVSVSPPPMLVLGELLEDAGIAIIFDCGSESVTFVITVALTPSSLVEDVPVRVGGPILDFGFCGFEGAPCTIDCPQFCTFNGFGSDCNCFESSGSTLNGDGCLVAVQEKAWGEVKRTFDQ